MQYIFSGWARQIVYLILFVSVIEMLLPTGELRRYVKLVLGLVVLVALIDPLLHALNGPGWADSLLLPTTATTYNGDTSVAAGVAMANSAITDATIQARSQTENEVANLLLTLGGVERAKVNLNGPRPKVVLILRSQEHSSDVAVHAQTLVAGATQVQPSDVDVTVELSPV